MISADTEARLLQMVSSQICHPSASAQAQQLTRATCIECDSASVREDGKGSSSQSRVCLGSGSDIRMDCKHSRMSLLGLEVALLMCRAVLQCGDCDHLQPSHMLEAQRSLLPDVDKSQSAQGQCRSSVHATCAGAGAGADATTGDTSGRRMAESSHLHHIMKGQLAASCCEQYACAPAHLHSVTALSRQHA